MSDEYCGDEKKNLDNCPKMRRDEVVKQFKEIQVKDRKRSDNGIHKNGLSQPKKVMGKNYLGD